MVIFFSAAWDTGSMHEVAGREVTYHDTLIRIPWIVGEGWNLPMWVAGYGPRALRTIGRHADGFVLQLADPQILEWTMDAVRAAAEDVGRNPDEIKICVVAPAYVGDNLQEQRDQLRWFGGMVGNHVADLVDRVVSVGSAGSGTEQFARHLLSAYDLDYDAVEVGRVEIDLFAITDEVERAKLAGLLRERLTLEGSC